MKFFKENKNVANGIKLEKNHQLLLNESIWYLQRSKKIVFILDFTVIN